MTLVEIVEEGRNHLICTSLDGSLVLYERIGNTIHTGKREELDPIVSWLKNEPYTPQFTSLPLREQPHEFSQLVLNVTEACNLACKYCTYSGIYEGERVNTADGAMMTPDIAFKAIDLFATNAKEGAGISFYGGEPTLAFDLIEKVVGYVNAKYSDRNFKFNFTSNFVGIRPHLEYLINNDFNLTVSIDGPKSVHDAWRVDVGNRPTFDSVVRNLHALRELDLKYFKYHVGFSAVYTSSEDFHKMVAFFLEEELFKNGHIVMGPAERTLLKDPSLFREMNPKTLSEIINHMMNIYIENIIAGKQNPPLLRTYFDMDLLRVHNREQTYMPTQLLPGGTCYPSARKLFVETNGSLHICEKMGLRHPLGSVDQGLDFNKAEALLEEFTALKNEVCKDCWAARSCSSCIASAKGVNGLSARSLLESCDSHKSGIIAGIAIYVTLIQQDSQQNYIPYLSNIKIK